jgi:hypothetical protein
MRASGARRCVSPAPGGDRRRFMSRTGKRTTRNARPRMHRPSARCRHDRVKRRMPLCPVHLSPLSVIASPLAMPHLPMVVSPLRSPAITHDIQRHWRLPPRPSIHDRCRDRIFPARHPSDARPKRPEPISSMRPVRSEDRVPRRKRERERKNSTALTALQGFIAGRCLARLRRRHDDEVKQMTARRAARHQLIESSLHFPNV